ncbi:MAG: response regulator transcription factor [Erysipelotrichaceae bacterium]|nr:response regulator transcription factor [Erysipelotrichaceae bacterium]
MNRILICDDERDIVEALKIYLAPEGYQLFTAYDGQQALEIVRNSEIDLILMDIMMPKMDGIRATSELRKLTNVPIIFLTAKSEDSDKILGLDIGADDYITKPFNPVEVKARVRSHLRRYTQLGSKPASTSVLQIGGIVLDDDRKTVTVDGESAELTPVEYGILKLLMSNPGKVFSSDEIYSEVWKEIPLTADGVVSVHIRHLREKIEINPSEPRYVKVVWGHGYKMENHNE